MGMDLVHKAQGNEAAPLGGAARTPGSGWNVAAHATDPPELDSVFKALADSTRREILYLLRQRELAVSEIVDHFHLTQPSISRHLAVLRSAGLVGNERRGQRVIYTLGTGELLDRAACYLAEMSAEARRRFG